jgi:hypothetical protein
MYLLEYVQCATYDRMILLVLYFKVTATFNSYDIRHDLEVIGSMLTHHS